MKIFLGILITLFSVTAFGQGRLTNADFATLAQIQAASGTAANLLNDDKIYVQTNGINKTLSQAIADKNIGGGGGAMGINLIENDDFEIDVTTGWVTSGTSVTSQLYANPTEDNKRFVEITSTASGGYYETEPLIVPNILANGDLQTQAFVYPVSGTWSIQSLSGTTVVASQTLTVGTDFVKSPIIFNPAGPASGSMKVRFQAVASGSVLRADNLYNGEPVNLKNGAVVEAESAFVPVYSGFGVVTSSTATRARIGDKIYLRGKFTAGTGAGTPNIGLPLGLIIDSTKYPTVRACGVWFNDAVGTQHGGAILCTGGNAYFEFGPIGTFSNSTVQSLTPASIGAVAGAGNIISYDMSVAVLGFTGSSTTFDSRCPNDIACTNEFSAAVGGAGAVTQESLDWINGNCSVSTNVYTCLFNTGVFSSAPNCSLSTNPGATNGAAGSIDAISSSQIVYRTFGTTTANNLPFPVYLKCQKQGADFVAKRTVEGFLSKNMTHSGDAIKREAWASFGGAGSFASITACTVSPCTKYGGDSAITGATRASAGVYSVNILAGSFSLIDTPLANALNVGGSVFCQAGISTLTTVAVECRNTVTGVLTDWAFSINIKGNR